MLTSDLVKASLYRGKLKVRFMDPEDHAVIQIAETLMPIFQSSTLRSLGQIRDEVKIIVDSQEQSLPWKAMSQVLESRLVLAEIDGKQAAALRKNLFEKAARLRLEGGFNAEKRTCFLENEAAVLDVTPRYILDGLFADLPGNELVKSFEDISPSRLIALCNIGAAQGVLLRATGIRLQVNEPSSRVIRRLLRSAKFHQLVWSAKGLENGAFQLLLDGPMSLFESTLKYGVKLACFLPNALGIPGIILHADLLWGRNKTKCSWDFVNEATSFGPTHSMPSHEFPELEEIGKIWDGDLLGWDIKPSGSVFPMLERGFWVPDHVIRRREDGAEVHLEILAHWRKDTFPVQLKALDQMQGLNWLIIARKSGGEPIDHPYVGWYRSFPSPEKVIEWAGKVLKLRCSGVT